MEDVYETSDRYRTTTSVTICSSKSESSSKDNRGDTKTNSPYYLGAILFSNKMRLKLDNPKKGDIILVSYPYAIIAGIYVEHDHNKLRYLPLDNMKWFLGKKDKYYSYFSLIMGNYIRERTYKIDIKLIDVDYDYELIDKCIKKIKDEY